MQFRLRTLLTAISLLACVLGALAWQLDTARREQRAIAAWHRIGGHVSLNSSDSLPTDVRFDASREQRRTTRRIDDWLGFQLFGRVIAVHAPHGDRTRAGKRFDEALLCLGDVRETQLVDFNHLAVTDRDLDFVRPLRRLRTLYLCNAAVGDEGMSHIAHLTELRRLSLEGTRVTDVGIERLQNLKNLDTLSLTNTDTTDACVAGLCELANLTFLDVRRTHVSAEGVAQLRQSLPHATIASDHDDPALRE